MAEFSGIDDHGDICRVCRSEGSVDKPLFYPCVCTGSIKYIHQDCLVQWLKYSKKEFCELCNHKFSFRPIYSADMPKRLPLQDIISGLLKSVGRALKYWLHYTLVALAWLGLVPLVACRICRSLFTGSVSSLLTLPSDMISSSNIVTDIINGGFVVICSLCVFISLFAGRAADGGAALQMQDMPLDVMDEMDPDDELDLADDEDDEEWHDEMGDEVGAGDNQGVDGDAAAQQAAQQINQANWNPIGWERAPEELTWERLLGLDGSLVFLEHVFWVISLNTLFVLVFAFCPYHIGQWTVSGLRLSKYAEASKFEGVLTTMVGYVVVAMCLMILYTIMALTRLHKVRVFVGLSYIVVKVTILIVGEIGLFPLVCGWWLDLCSLPMFNATIHTRGESFNKAPGTAMFVHWLIGMVYVFYFASFILLLREIFRPGVLWFLRNVNDPEFNPIQEMVHIGVYRHSRRFILSMLIFGSTVMLMLWLPIRFIKYMFPGFLPYHVALSNDAPISELSLELLLLQVVLPSLLDQGHTRTWFKSLVVCWTRCVANLLNLNSYLLGNEDLEDKENIIRVDNDPVRVGVPAAPGNPGGPVGEAHQALLNMHGSSGFKPYYRPKYFHLRVIPHVLSLTVNFLIEKEQYDWYSDNVRIPFWGVLFKRINTVFAVLHTGVHPIDADVHKSIHCQCDIPDITSIYWP
ncbi:MARCH6 [Bugula neritina]|uniref:E3 ubiquitin-protein ligase MARCHF6 n=1 Tax=Bugula neritina TaxID=10212 RepID=A0A7J7K0B1_BUGNE|nr:MARCH6 [Bugula neritina]